MAEFIAGSTMTISWIWSGGTVTPAADYRTCTFSPTVDYVDVSAGSDTHKGRLTALKDSTASCTFVNPTASTNGTLYAACFATGVSGTLIIQPEGTATNKRKITMPAYCDGGVPEFPYADVSVLSVSFTGNGAFTDGVN